MKKRILAAIAAAVVLSGCAPKTSPEMHARHFVYQGMESHDANLIVDKAGSVTSLLPTFQQLYNAGKADRACGRDAAYAQQQATALRSQALAEESTGNFNNHNGQLFSEKRSPREAAILGDDLAQTYLDGFNGK